MEVSFYTRQNGFLFKPHDMREIYIATPSKTTRGRWQKQTSQLRIRCILESMWKLIDIYRNYILSKNPAGHWHDEGENKRKINEQHVQSFKILYYSAFLQHQPWRVRLKIGQRSEKLNGGLNRSFWPGNMIMFFLRKFPDLPRLGRFRKFLLEKLHKNPVNPLSLFFFCRFHVTSSERRSFVASRDSCWSLVGSRDCTKDPVVLPQSWSEVGDIFVAMAQVDHSWNGGQIHEHLPEKKQTQKQNRNMLPG